MNYINHWKRPITLAYGAVTAELDLPDGSYRLTITDGDDNYEIIDAVVADGTATLTRAREGTSEAAWPVGSTIFYALTAEQLTGLGGGMTPLLVAQAGQSVDIPPSGAYVSLQAHEGVATARLPESPPGAWILRCDVFAGVSGGGVARIELPAGWLPTSVDVAGTGPDVAYDAASNAVTMTSVSGAYSPFRLTAGYQHELPERQIFIEIDFTVTRPAYTTVYPID